MNTLNEHISSMSSIPINGQLFCISNKPVNSHTLSNHLREILLANELPLIRFHDLRHILVDKEKRVTTLSTL